MTTTANTTVDLGNNESVSRGVFLQNDGTWIAMTFTKSKTFKTEAGARKWLQKARAESAQSEARRIVARGCCPQCGSKLVRNYSLTGWWQCEQFGAVGFRADGNRPTCSWQAFTE